MRSIRCKCGKKFEIEHKEDSLTLTFACPFCKPKTWRLTKVSGIKWRIYPYLRDLILSYKLKG